MADTNYLCRGSEFALLLVARFAGSCAEPFAAREAGDGPEQPSCT